MVLIQLNGGWITDLDSAKALAKEKDRLILLAFTGSDWCIHCKKMKKDVFESAEFIAYAEKNLVLVNADFPKKKKNKLPESLHKKNEKLAAIYNPEKVFPFTVLMDTEGKVLRSWRGATGSGLLTKEIEAIQKMGPG